MSLETLKAEAYDVLLQMEKLQLRMRELNLAIARHEEKTEEK